MKRLILALIILTPLVFAANETSNDTTGNQTIWYEQVMSKVSEGDTITLVSILIGLIIVNFLGKLAFKLIKWAIILVAILLALKFIA